MLVRLKVLACPTKVLYDKDMKVTVKDKGRFKETTGINSLGERLPKKQQGSIHLANAV